MSRDPLRAIGRLADPVRRRLYDIVASRSQPTSREAAAEEAGIRRSLAAYHLDKLVAEGLLETSYARTGERTGPGAARTALVDGAYRLGRETVSPAGDDADPLVNALAATGYEPVCAGADIRLR